MIYETSVMIARVFLNLAQIFARLLYSHRLYSVSWRRTGENADMQVLPRGVLCERQLPLRSRESECKSWYMQELSSWLLPW